MYRALHLSPMIPSFNIRETVSFFVDLLGFSIRRDDQSYVILCKDNFLVHILTAGPDIGEMELYLEVDDIDQLWDSMFDKVRGLKVKRPFNREYGMREVHIVIPATNTLMFIGQVINA